jgi:hypothetical protein
MFTEISRIFWLLYCNCLAQVVKYIVDGKLRFIGESPRFRAKRLESFAQAFSKACSDPTRARWIGGRFLKKATEKLSSRFALNRSINQNLKTHNNILTLRAD